MIAHLKGNLLSSAADSLVLDVAGVGYEIYASLHTLDKVKTGTNPVSLIIYTAVREDNISLFGFLTAREKQLFLRLISVSGIGPKLAMTILSGLPSEKLIEAIYHEDLIRLTSISGIGKKTAERMIVELKDKLLALSPALEDSSPKRGGVSDDVLSALLNLGYNRSEIEKTFDRIKVQHKTNFEEALKESLQALAKS